MSDLKAPDRNKYVGSVADILKQLKGYGDQYEVKPWVPLLGGTGLGELFMGKAPEFVDDVSYNPRSAIRGGNVATGGLGTYTLDKRVADTGMLAADAVGVGKLTSIPAKIAYRKAIGDTLDKTKREFILGRNKAFEDKANEAIYEPVSGVGKALDEVARTPVSRRDVLKAGAAGATMAAVPALLRNFGKGADTAVAHGADNVAVKAADALPKYKFNSLKEYLDDVRYGMDDSESEIVQQYFNRTGHGIDSGKPLTNDVIQAAEREAKEFENKMISERLLDDETQYRSGKSLFGKGGTRDPEVYDIPEGYKKSYEDYKDRSNWFSPQAKAEMKQFKEAHHNNWAEGDSSGWGNALPEWAPKWYEASDELFDFARNLK